jgi:1-acyl-sn-glycerol-3-phosphate acyltransferase
MKPFLLSMHDGLRARRGMVPVSLVALVAVAAIALGRLEFREDIADFLPGSEANARVNAVYRHAGNSNRIIVTFSAGGDEGRVVEAIDRFTLLLNERDSAGVIPGVISRVDEERLLDLVDFVRQNPPYFLAAADYVRFDTLLSEAFVAARAREARRLLMLPSGSLAREEIQADPLHLFSHLLLQLNDFRAGEQEARDGYLFTRGGQKGMVIIESPHGVSETARNAALVAMIEGVIGEVTRALPGVEASCTGAPAIAVTNAARIKRDSVLAISLSAAIILVLLIYFFRDARDILLVFLSVAFGWLFALALLALFKGSVSIIAVGIGSIFTGIAINYPLHLIGHLKHQPDARRALREVTAPLLVGNVTTVSAFLSLLFLSSPAMRDLGLFGSLLLVGTILFVLVYLPLLVKARPAGRERALFGRVAAFAPERERWIVWPVVLLTILFLYLGRFTTFEPDMNKINYMTDRQRADMHDLVQSLERQEREVVYFVSTGRGLDAALARHERDRVLLDSLRREGLIESIAGIGPFLASTDEQRRRLERWNAFWQPRRDALERQLDAAARAEGFRPGAFAPFTRLLHADFTPRDEAWFAPVTSLLAGNYLVKSDDTEMVISLLYCRKGETAALEDALRPAMHGDSFFFDSRDLGQRVVDALSGDFNRVLYICGLVVFLFLTLSLGRVELSLMAFLPLAVGWVWILGIMHLGDIRFNIVNVILATFIFGQGDDYTIFITEGLMHEHAYRRRVLASYKNSILLSALIMFAGIGTLIFARHPALRSLAEVTIVGMFSVVTMAYLLPPLLFRWLTRDRRGPRAVPVTIRRLLYSGYSFAAFLAGTLVISVTGFVLLDLGRRTERNRARYHALLCRVARFVIRHVPGVRFRHENLAGETFERPAVIISNHQSHLDLMCLLMLTPRLVILTNDWVWNNPFYGRLVKYADFYPVSGGIENSLEILADRARAGYSIVVFPEGTRSADSTILRFHQGAFYLAERLQLEIIPVLIHGAGAVLPRHDFMLRAGSISVQVHPRLSLDGDLAARARQARQYYRQALATLARSRETAAYFRSFVLHNYLYKGVAIERSARAMLRRGACFSRCIDAYRGAGPVLVVNNGNGVFSFLFALVHEHARVVAIEQDEDKVALARGCAGIPANLTIYPASELPAGIAFETTYTLEEGWINT